MAPTSEPDFSAEYLHTLAIHAGEMLAKETYHSSFSELSTAQRASIQAEVQQLLKQNRYALRNEDVDLHAPGSRII